MNRFTIINNEFLPAAQAAVLVTDLAVQRGYGIFDFFKILNGKPVLLDDHLDRFYTSAAAMHLPVAQNRQELKALLYELIDKNRLADSGIRITLTGGYSTDGYTLAVPNMIITQQELAPNKATMPRGIKLITYPHLRQLPQVKTLDYLMAIWLQPLIKQKEANDVLYHHNGLVKECPRANFFIVTPNNQVLTSGTNILKGIIRKQLLKLNEDEFVVKEKDITLADLQQCKEAFITSTTKNILPVTSIDGRTISNGSAGKITTALAQKLQNVIQGYL